MTNDVRGSRNIYGEPLQEIVRCKDCKYMILDETNKYQIWCSLDNSPWYEDDFCSRAKRKGGAE